MGTLEFFKTNLLTFSNTLYVMKKLETLFWKNCRQFQKLESERMKAIRKWNVPELDRIDNLISLNQQEGNNIIDQMKKLATA